MRTLLERNHLYIDGEWTSPASKDRIPVISPVTEQPIGWAPDGSNADMDRAVEAARAAFDHGPWPKMPHAERAARLRRLADAYAAHGDDMGWLITAEMGSPYEFTKAAQVPHPLGILRFYGDLGTRYQFDELRGDASVRREPAGVVAVIVPWNMPQKTILMKVAPALLAGCTVVIKPAPETPLDALLLAEIVDEAGLPHGVVNVVPAGRDVGEYLVSHEDVDKVAFTGSTAAGRRIASICGNDIRRVSLELGGKSACVILDDADLDAVIPSLKGDSLANNGQICSNQTRILVPEHMHDEVVHRIIDLIESMPLGDPADPSVQMGPLVAERQRDRVEGYLWEGQREGAALVHGGERPDRSGWFINPAVFAHVDNRMRIAQEEIFGPVLAVIPYCGKDSHAIGIANYSTYGLHAGVWSADTQRALRIARKLRVGTVQINGAPTGLDAPIGGYKGSGIGRELGPEGLAGYLETKVIAVSGGR